MALLALTSSTRMNNWTGLTMTFLKLNRLDTPACLRELSHLSKRMLPKFEHNQSALSNVVPLNAAHRGIHLNLICNANPTGLGLLPIFRRSSTFWKQSLTNMARRKYSTKKPQKLEFEQDTNVSANVMIFSHQNDRFYTLFSYFGAIQFLFWGYLAMFSFSSLRDVPVDSNNSNVQQEGGQKAPWWRLVNFGENKYKNGIALLCFSIGYIVFFISIMYPLRAVQSLWLLKGGKSIGIVTYAPFGRKLSIKAPLENINCMQSRAQAASQVPIKVKGKWFFYLLDKKGVFHNPELFDKAVGLKRKLK